MSGNSSPNAILEFEDQYAMIVKSVLLLIISVVEFVTTLFERIFIVVYVDTRNVTLDNDSCALDSTSQFHTT